MELWTNAARAVRDVVKQGRIFGDKIDRSPKFAKMILASSEEGLRTA
jgi:hypothetical protein